MAKICYIAKKFNKEHTYIIDQANIIIDRWRAAGYDLTLRQVYYQFVKNNLFPKDWADPKTGSTNNIRSYKSLGSILNDARLAGQVDWSSIEDRTRNLESLAHWETPAIIVESISRQFRVDLWIDQPCYVEVWVEKDALVGVVGRICQQYDVPYFSCRGYTSQSEMWSAAQRLVEHAEYGQATHIIHLGDHDPSGKDMTRDVTDRLKMFMEHDEAEAVEVERIALNMDQVRKYKPPPNPAKITDSRAEGYIAEFGEESWELDALEPNVISDLIEAALRSRIDDGRFRDRKKLVAKGREMLAAASMRWSEIETLLSEKKK